MLLGIGLHAALAYAMIPWAVEDSRRHPFFGAFVALVHDFRMPLFFLISGFFTAMLWRQKGLNALLWHRFQRVLIPCLLGVVTILPLTAWVNRQFAIPDVPKLAVPATNTQVATPIQSLTEAIRRTDRERIDELSRDPARLSQPDPEFSVQPLAWAAMLGDEQTVSLLLDRKASLAGKNGDGSTALHGAAFTGRPAIVRMLLDHGADPLAKSNDGTVPYQTTFADRGITDFIFGALRIPPRKPDELAADRLACRELLPAPPAAPEVRLSLRETIRKRYTDWLTSPFWLVRVPGRVEPLHLLFTPVFDHLWFLWFLCWFVGLFAVGILAVRGIVRRAVPSHSEQASAGAGREECDSGWRYRLVVSPVRLLWLIPVTMLPQLLMGLFSPAVGPDTSLGLLPQPHVLFYYGIFFGYGMLYFAVGDPNGRHGRHWWLTLPVSLCVLLPIMLWGGTSAGVSALVQVSYAWLMSAGCMGLFQRFLSRPRGWIRYLSDSSYWLYLVHLPMLFWLQGMTRSWPVSPFLKFVAVCVVATVLLLISYEALVRHTWLGALLNGRRTRPQGNTAKTP